MVVAIEKCQERRLRPSRTLDAAEPNVFIRSLYIPQIP